jgi:hypothetical protein
VKSLPLRVIRRTPAPSPKCGNRHA